MVSVKTDRKSDFETSPETEVPRRIFCELVGVTEHSSDTEGSCGRFLTMTAAAMRSVNLKGEEFDGFAEREDGNRILDTVFCPQPNTLMIYVDLKEVSLMEGRAFFELKPLESGFRLEIQEKDLYKNSRKPEAYSIKRWIVRDYEVCGDFYWAGMLHSFNPDGTLVISVPTRCKSTLQPSSQHNESGQGLNRFGLPQCPSSYPTFQPQSDPFKGPCTMNHLQNRNWPGVSSQFQQWECGTCDGSSNDRNPFQFQSEISPRPYQPFQSYAGTLSDQKQSIYPQSESR